MWIDSLFAHLAAIYGARFTNQWPPGAVDSVRDEWAKILAPFENKPEAMQYALDNLPSDHVPMVLEIRDLCRQQAKPVSRRRLPAMTEEERAHALDILKAWDKPGRQDARDWARKLRAREMAGERLTLFQRNAWREALHAPPSSEISETPDESTT